MPVALGIRLEESRPIDVTLKRWNEAVRFGLKEAAAFWVDYYMPKHFQPNAASLYGYPSLSRKYILRKIRTRKFFDRVTGQWYERRPGVHPLEWGGFMKRSLLSRRSSGFNITAIATGKRARATVPLQVQGGRIYGTEKVWEPLSKVNPDELETMSRIVVDSALRFLDLGG